MTAGPVAGCRELSCAGPKPGARWVHCAACHEHFTSEAAFDAHRVGKFGADRRCATREEMTQRGMHPNVWGRWVSPAHKGSGVPPWAAQRSAAAVDAAPQS